MPEIDLLHTFDGSVWAKEFCRITGFEDEARALTWFCNAIMAGYDEAKRQARADVLGDAIISDLEADLDRCRARLVALEREHAENMFRAGEIAGGLIKKLQASERALERVREAWRKIEEGFEAEVFVRNVTRDGESGWAVRFLPYAKALGDIQAALASPGSPPKFQRGFGAINPLDKPSPGSPQEGTA